MAKTKTPETPVEEAPEPPAPVVVEGAEQRAEAERFIDAERQSHELAYEQPARVVMTREVAAKLRAPFAPEQIGLLPKPTNKDNAKGNCEVCGKYHGLPAVHLDYVGHAAATDRLLQIDPCWSWRPMATDPATGHPILDNKGGMWIVLTVAGVSRPGYGDGASMKEIIGDAIRNAAMRFGVALDLWSKEDLNAVGDVDEQALGATGDLRDYDPGAVMVPGAPAGWRPIMDALADIDPSIDWIVVITSALEQAFNVSTRAELGENEQEAGRRIANAVALMQSEHPAGQMPPISDTEIQEAFSWAFGGEGKVLVTIPEPDPGALADDAPETEETDEPEAAAAE